MCSLRGQQPLIAQRQLVAPEPTGTSANIEPDRVPSPRTLSLHSLPSEHFFLVHLLTHSALPACAQAEVGRASRAGSVACVAAKACWRTCATVGRMALKLCCPARARALTAQ